MTACFLHTADWQLGKAFAGVTDPHKRVLLQQERLAVLGRIGAAARAGGAQFIVVAGDLFDTPSVTRATVAAACAAIGALPLPVLAIPGNHDHGGPGSLWEQDFFQRESAALAPNLRVLRKPEPVAVAGAVILPCPLLRRHESVDTTAWIRALDPAALPAGPRIVLAHGSIHGFAEEDGAVNRLDLARLPAAEIDYVALGDWHGTKQIDERAWYAGTPEQDRFARGEGNEPGHVLLVTASRGTAPRVERVRTARLGWHRLDFELTGDADLARLDAALDALLGQRAQQDLLDLTLRGELGIEASRRLAEKLEAWDARLLRLQRAQEIRVAPTRDEIEALTQRLGDPLIARVAAQLVRRASGGETDPALADLALRELHALARPA